MQKNKSSLFTILFFSTVVTQTITISADFSQEIPLQGISEAFNSFTSKDSNIEKELKEPFEEIGEGLKLSLEKKEEKTKEDEIKEEQVKKEINSWIAALMKNDLNGNSPFGMFFSAAILGTAVGGVYLVGGSESIPQIAQGIVSARDHFNTASPLLQTLYTVLIFGLMHAVNPEFTNKMITILGEAKPVYKIFKNIEKENIEKAEKAEKAKSKEKEKKRKKKEEKEKEAKLARMEEDVSKLNESVIDFNQRSHRSGVNPNMSNAFNNVPNGQRLDFGNLSSISSPEQKKNEESEGEDSDNSFN